MDASSRGQIFLWEAGTGKLVLSFRVQTQATASLAFADAGKTLVSAGFGIVSWWDVETGKEKKSWKPFGDEEQPAEGGTKKTKIFNNCSLSPDGCHLATEVAWRYFDEKVKALQKDRMENKEAAGFDLASGKMRWHGTGKIKAGPTRFAYSADAKRIAVAMSMDQIEFRDTATGKLLTPPPDPNLLHVDWSSDLGPVGALALSADGSTVAIAGKESRVVLWKPNDPSAPRKFEARIAQYWGNSTRTLCFSHDNKKLWWVPTRTSNSTISPR